MAIIQGLGLQESELTRFRMRIRRRLQRMDSGLNTCTWKRKSSKRRSITRSWRRLSLMFRSVRSSHRSIRLRGTRVNPSLGQLLMITLKEVMLMLTDQRHHSMFQARNSSWCISKTWLRNWRSKSFRRSSKRNKKVRKLKNVLSNPHCWAKVRQIYEDRGIRLRHPWATKTRSTEWEWRTKRNKGKRSCLKSKHTYLSSSSILLVWVV